LKKANDFGYFSCMGRYYAHKKPVAERLTAIDIRWLRKFGYLESESGLSVIVYGASGSVGLRIHNYEYRRVIRAGDTEIRLETTPCNLGGFRYWFLCPEFSCGKRVAVLYATGNVIACRHCLNLTYKARNESGSMRVLSRIFGKLLQTDRKHRLKESIKVPYYNGRPTRKQRQYENLEEKSSRHSIIETALIRRMNQENEIPTP
jgi:hypothetical protein